MTQDCITSEQDVQSKISSNESQTRKRDTLPDVGFVRLATVLQLIPVGKTTWWNGVKSGRFPKPVKLGQRTTAWRVEDIRALIEEHGQNE